MTFLALRFPEDISYGSSGGPKFRTTIFSADSGYEQRNIDWSQVRCEYDVSHAIKNRAQMNELQSFFYVARGRAYGFRFKDYGDFQMANAQIGVGDGVTTSFQLVKTYTAGAYSYGRTITKPVSGTLTTVLVAGSPVSPASVDYETGIVTLSAAPTAGQSVVVSSCEFDVPVRFDTDHLDSTHDFWEHQSWNSIPLVETRDIS